MADYYYDDVDTEQSDYYAPDVVPPQPGQVPPAYGQESFAVDMALTNAGRAAAGDKGAALRHRDYVHYLQVLQDTGPGEALDNAWESERDRQIAGLKDLAEKTAAMGNAEGAAALIQAVQATSEAANPTQYQKNLALAKQAVERVAVPYLEGYPSPEAAVDAIGGAAQSRALHSSLAQLIAEKQKELQDKTQITDIIRGVAQGIVPGGSYFADRTVKAWMKEKSGSTATNLYDVTKDFLNVLSGATPDQQAAMLDEFVKSGGNPWMLQHQLQRIMKYSSTEHAVDVGLDILDLAGTVATVAELAKAGRAANVTRRLADQAATGRLVAGDILRGTNLSDLPRDEKIAAAIAAGRNPWLPDTNAMAGLSTEIQKQLTDSAKQLYSQLQESLRSTGRTPEDVRQALADLRAKYDPRTNPSIHSAFFGDGTERGQDMLVFWQSRDGKVFGTREEAEAYAKEVGLVGTEAVPEQEALRLGSASVPGNGVMRPSAEDWMRLPGEFTDDEKAMIQQELDVRRQAAQSMAENGDTGAAAALEAQLAEIESAIAKNDWRAVDDLTYEWGLFEDGPNLDFTTSFAELERLQRERAKVSNTPLGTELFKDGNVQVMPGFDKRAADIVKGLYKMFGMRDRLVIGLAEDFRDVHKLFPEIGDISLSGPGRDRKIWDAVNPNGSAGAHYVQFGPGGKAYHVIGLRSFDPKDPRQVWTLVHELGHAFHVEFLRSGKAARELNAAAAAEFKAWMKSKFPTKTFDKQKWDEFMARVHNPMAAEKQVNKIGRPDPSFVEWAKAYEEFWAEQFARYAFTKSPKNVIARHVKGVIDKMKQAYEYVRGVIRDKYGVELPEMDVAPAIKRILDERLIAVREGRVPEFDISMMQLQFGLHDMRVAGKPHIKLKVPKDQEVPGNMLPAKEGWVLKQIRKDPLDYVGSESTFSKEDISSMPWLAVDPKHAASYLAVEERVVGIHAQHKMMGDMKAFLDRHWSGLSGESRQRVQNVLAEGDAYSNLDGQVGREFTYTDLVERGLTEPEMEAYFAARHLRRVTWEIRNGEMVRHLVAQGYRAGRFSVIENGAGRLVEVHARKVDFTKRGTTLEDRTVWDARTNTARRVDSDTADELMNGGGEVWELHEATEIGGKFYRHVIVDPNKPLMGDITKVLPYRPGEYSRIYTDEYFIQRKIATTVDGEAQEVAQVLFTAKSEAQAREFVERLNSAKQLADDIHSGRVVIPAGSTLEKEIGKRLKGAMPADEFVSSYQSGGLDGVRYDWKYTRTEEEYLTAHSSLSRHGGSAGPYYGRRGGKIDSLDGTPNTLDVARAMSAEITNVSRVVNIQEWRENLIRKWMNSFRDMLDPKDLTGDDVADFFRLAGVKFAKNSKEGLFAERTHKYIMRQLTMKTKEEELYDNWIRAFSEKFFNVPRNSWRNSVGAQIRSGDLLSVARVWNFNFALGLWNPAQWIVQANGMATAAILHPIYGLQAAKTGILVRLALMSDNPAIWKHVARFEKLTNLGLSDTDEFVKLVRAVDRSGILANLKSTALHNRTEGRLIFGAGPLRKIGQSHTFFFNRGEEASRLVAFDVARRKWMDANPGADWTTDLALKDIVKDADDLTQNMTDANLGFWQRGLLSIPTQFLQYNFKLAANVGTALVAPGRGYTRAQALQLLTGHLVLYGGLGTGASWLIDEMLPDSQKDALTPEQKQYINEGLIAGLIDTLSQEFVGKPAKVAAGSRLGVFNFYVELGRGLFDKHDLWQALTGPTGRTAGKGLGVVNDVVGLFATPESVDLTVSGVVEALGELPPTSLSSVAKAYVAWNNEGVMTDRTGTPLASLSGPEQIALALGFTPSQAMDVYRMRQAKRDSLSELKEIAGEIYKQQQDIIRLAKQGTPEAFERIERKRKLIAALMPRNTGDAFFVQRHIKDHLFAHDTQFQDLLGEYLMKGLTRDLPLITTSPAGSVPAEPRAKAQE